MAASSFRAGPGSGDDASDDRTEAAGSEKFANGPAVTGTSPRPVRVGDAAMDQHAKDTAPFRKRLGLHDRQRLPRLLLRVIKQNVHRVRISRSLFLMGRDDCPDIFPTTL